MEQGGQRTYMVFLLIVHERSDCLTSIGTVPGLTADMNGGTANAKVVNGARDGTRRRYGSSS